MDRIPFSQHLAYLERGVFDAECTEALAELVMAVKATGKPGKITVTLDLKFDSKMNCMDIAPTVKAKVPQLDRRRTFMFPNNAGELLRDDPEQEELFRRPATVPTTPNLEQESA